MHWWTTCVSRWVRFGEEHAAHVVAFQLHPCTMGWPSRRLTGAGTSPPAWPAGTRVLLQTVAGLILHQPLLAVLLQQCIIVALVTNSDGYCACPLLNNPLAARRLARLARCLDALPIVSVPLSSTAELHRNGEKWEARGVAQACCMRRVCNISLL